MYKYPEPDVSNELYVNEKVVENRDPASQQPVTILQIMLPGPLVLLCSKLYFAALVCNFITGDAGLSLESKGTSSEVDESVEATITPS